MKNVIKIKIVSRETFILILFHVKHFFLRGDFMEWIKGENHYLTDDEIDNNAEIICTYLMSKGWTKNASCGIIANMWKESNCNPNFWESGQTGNTSCGFGLVQWTPSTIITSWLKSHGKSLDDGYAQLDKIIEEVHDGSQWIPTSFSNMTFEEFTKSTLDPSFLAEVFIKNYERPLDSNQPDRYAKATYFFKKLTGKGEISGGGGSGEVYKKIEESNYNLNKLSEDDKAFLKSLSFNDKVKIKRTFERGKGKIGVSFCGKHLTFTHGQFIIIDIDKKGRCILKKSEKNVNRLSIYPKYLCKGD